MDSFLQRPRVQDLWETINRAAHQSLLRVLEDETREASPPPEERSRSTSALFVVNVGEELGFGEQLDARLPADAGQITVLESDQLSAAQTAVKTIKALSWLVILLAIAVFAGAIWLARGRRRCCASSAPSSSSSASCSSSSAAWPASYIVDALARRRVGPRSGRLVVDHRDEPARRGRLGADRLRRRHAPGAVLAGPSGTRAACAVRSPRSSATGRERLGGAGRHLPPARPLGSRPGAAHVARACSSSAVSSRSATRRSDAWLWASSRREISGRPRRLHPSSRPPSASARAGQLGLEPSKRSWSPSCDPPPGHARPRSRAALARQRST